MAFNGIYTSILLGGVFSPKYLEEYLTAYLWGAAILLSVNILVLPMSSERVLRKTLAISLEHIAHLLPSSQKGILLLVLKKSMMQGKRWHKQSRRTSLFTQKINETNIGVNRSNFSMGGEPSFLLFPCNSLPLPSRLSILLREGPNISVQPDHRPRQR